MPTSLPSNSPGGAHSPSIWPRSPILAQPCRPLLARAQGSPLIRTKGSPYFSNYIIFNFIGLWWLRWLRSCLQWGDLGSIPGLGRSPGKGKGYLLQYSGLQNSIDCIVHRVANSQTQLSDSHFTSFHLSLGTISK